MCGGNGNLQKKMEKSGYALLDSLKHACVSSYVGSCRAVLSTTTHSVKAGSHQVHGTPWQLPKTKIFADYLDAYFHNEPSPTHLYGPENFVA
jgi:hypothetical protein